MRQRSARNGFRGAGRGGRGSDHLAGPGRDRAGPGGSGDGGGRPRGLDLGALRLQRESPGALVRLQRLRRGARAVSAAHVGWGIAQDGILGPNTRDAVMAAQYACGIGVDGIVGPNTWRCLHPRRGAQPRMRSPGRARTRGPEKVIEDEYPCPPGWVAARPPWPRRGTPGAAMVRAARHGQRPAPPAHDAGPASLRPRPWPPRPRRACRRSGG
ncbi:peptidoglycan-binding domain-containing protein [Streptomyces sp. 8K308]|uniref:peptidoglycan-binding domain-containing protein n=1 Tax=Streptomyces sp. 8K308 TaxID=2530388 RepID=UPI002441EE5E|nr:peptidoglycan-binding domain-containing protein [Streptomyces sp. 8K308]